MLVRLASRLASLKRKSSRPQWLIRFFGLDSQAHKLDTAERHQFHRGLVMVQIDGLGHHEFERALAKGELPFLKKLLDHQHYETHSVYSGLPSSTPSVQGELFYGVKTAVPAFSFVDRESGELQRMFDPTSASAMEAQLAKSGRPLLSGGSAYSNIYTGGAAESHYCAASLGFGHSLESFKPLARLGIGLIFFPTLLRTLVLALVELVLAIVDFIKGIKTGYRVIPELKFIMSRVAICIGLRDIVSIGAQVDILRGLPIVHMNLLGYDEQAHRRGPRSAFAHWTLKGIDRCIKRIWQACNGSPVRHYDLWVYSDHGQEHTEPYSARSGVSLRDALSMAMCTLKLDNYKLAESASPTAPQAITSERARFLGGRILQRLLPSVKGTVEAEKGPSFRVAAMGPVGHVYARVLASTANREVLAGYLVRQADIPAVMYLDDTGQVLVVTDESRFRLPEDSSKFAGSSHPFAEIVGEDLVALCCHEDAGQLVLLGWASHKSAISFPFENGSHAGPGSRETHAFALLPTDTVLPESIQAERRGYLRPLDLRNAAFALLDQDPENPTSNRYPRKRAPRTRDPRSRDPHKRDPGSHAMTSLSVTEAAGDQSGDGQRRLRIMTYNVHGCVGMDGRHAPERIARVIAHFEPDIVALQELDVNRRRSRQTDQAETIARLLEMHYHFHPSMHVESGAYGNAILTHLPLEIVKAAQLPGHPGKRDVEPRGAIWASIEIADRKLQVVCTHLGLYPDERLVQVRALQSEQWLDDERCRKGPAVLCGDFNATPGSTALKSLDDCWQDVQAPDSVIRTSNYKTFTSIMPALRIDHVFTNAELRPAAIQVPKFELARRASDHLPLVVDLELTDLDTTMVCESAGS